MAQKVILLFLVFLNLCNAQPTNEEFKISPCISVSNNTNSNEVKEIQIYYDKENLEFKLIKVKEQKFLKFEEFVSDSVKVPVTYEIDFDTDNPIADNEIENSLISNRLSFVKKQLSIKR